MNCSHSNSHWKSMKLKVVIITFFYGNGLFLLLDDIIVELCYKLIVSSFLSYQNHYIPSTEREVGHIAFGADPVGVGSALLLLCALHVSPESMGGFWPNLHRHIMGGGEMIRFWWPWPHFQGLTSTLKFSNFDQKACLLHISWTKWWILVKLHIL